MIRGILFDMDGVLIDTELQGRDLYLQVCAEYGYPQVDESVYQKLLGVPYETGAAVLYREVSPDFPIQPISQKHAELLRERIGQMGESIYKKGLRECFEALKARGLRMALATSTSRIYLEKYQQILPLLTWFDATVCGVEAGHGKPEPDIYLEAARRLGLTPSECVGVEDSRAGLQSIKAAGATSVMIPDLIPYDDEVIPLVDHVLEDLSQLPDLIDRLNQAR